MLRQASETFETLCKNGQQGTLRLGALGDAVSGGGGGVSRTLSNHWQAIRNSRCAITIFEERALSNETLSRQVHTDQRALSAHTRVRPFQQEKWGRLWGDQQWLFENRIT